MGKWGLMTTGVVIGMLVVYMFTRESGKANMPTGGNMGYTQEYVSFDSEGDQIKGILFTPKGLKNPSSAVVLIGPVGFVKEQAPYQYATRLAQQGFVSLIFDPRYHGESEGSPRRFESGDAKTQDLINAMDFLVAQKQVDPKRLHLVAICQGVNWGIEASKQDSRVQSLSLVAGHYLMPEVAEFYLGGKANFDARMEKAQQAKAAFEASNYVEYIPVVSLTDKDALLLAKPIYDWYIPWANQSAKYKGAWENRITRMSELEIWKERDTREAVKTLQTTTLMIHSDKAASTIPPSYGFNPAKAVFSNIQTTNKTLVWLEGDQVQEQFYDDPATIDTSIVAVTQFIRNVEETL